MIEREPLKYIHMYRNENATYRHKSVELNRN